MESGELQNSRISLWELEEIKKVTEQARSDEKFQEMTIKEKAACLAGQFQKAADRRGILLKLRKKK